MATGQSYRFPAAHRIKKRPEFLALRNSGRLFRTRNFLVSTCNRTCGPTRLGITVTRRVGNAVVRNRVKRQVREFFRLTYPVLPAQVDISIVARNGAAYLTASEVHQELADLLVPSKGETIECPGTSSSR